MESRPNITYFLALVIFICLFGSTTGAQKNALAADQWTEQRRAAMVYIEVDPKAGETARGTGFLVRSSRGLFFVLTAAHIVFGEINPPYPSEQDGKTPRNQARINPCESVSGNSVRLKLGDVGGSPLDANCVIYLGGPDIAAIRIKAPGRELPTLALGRFDPASHGTLALLGFPFGEALQLTPEIVTLDSIYGLRHSIRYRGANAGGLSGAPYLSSDGLVVGIHSGVLTEEKTPRPGFLAMVPLSAASDALINLGLRLQEPGVQIVPSELYAVVQACSDSWGAEASSNVTTIFENMITGGMVEWNAAVEAGGTLVNKFKDEAKGREAYNKYIACVKPAIDKFITPEQQPKVVLIGSKEDYTDYHLEGLEQTSTEILDERLGMTFYTIPIPPVKYNWKGAESVRRKNPDVIVMHASAFHDDKHKDQAISKFQALVESFFSLPKTTFLVFSRLPGDHPSPDLCARWKRQVNFLTADKFKGRLFFYPLYRDESDFTGKAGIEISQILRCQTGLDATGYCTPYLQDRANEAQRRIEESLCAAPRP